MGKENIHHALERRFRQKIKKDKHIHNACLLVHSEKLGVHLKVAECSSEDGTVHPDQPVYIASAGKLFTAVLTGILVEQNLLSFEDSVVSYLKPDLVNRLHVYKGKEYTKDIQIKHLLNHTSGLPDFFEDRPRKGKPMIRLLLDESSRFWKPEEVVQWSKEHLDPHFPPGEGFHYSDTGYHLLGMVIEQITSMPFHQALQEYIFAPLGMYHSFLLQHSNPLKRNLYPMADIFVHKTAVTHYRSLSIDYAGGGIVAPLEDLLTFMKALVNYNLLTKETMANMKDWAKFSTVIEYGYGMMRFKTIPILMPKKFHVWGNAGITGSFMFYHPEMDAYLIGSLNQFRYHRKGIRLMFKMIHELSKSTNDENICKA